jgi:hypothetical protein
MSRIISAALCAGLFAALLAAGGWRRGSGTINVASEKLGAVAIADSEFGRYTAEQVIDGDWVRPHEPPQKNHWQSGAGKSHPHWVWIRFRKAARIEKVVLHPADLKNYPAALLGETSLDGGVTFSTLFTVTNSEISDKSFSFEKSFTPILTDNFRLRILQSCGNVSEARLSEVEVFGQFAGEQKSSVSVPLTSRNPAPSLSPSTADSLQIAERNGEIDFRSRWLRVVLSKAEPRINALCWDSLGEGKVNENFLKTSADGGVRLVQKTLFPEHCEKAGARKSEVSVQSQAIREGNVVRYSQILPSGVAALWEIRVEATKIAMSVTMESKEARAVREPVELRFAFDPSKTPVAPLANPQPGVSAQLPCLLHAADYGTLLVRSLSVGGACLNAERAVRALIQWNASFQPQFAARASDGLFVQAAGTNQFALEFSVEAATPLPALVAEEPRLRALSRTWLNPFQYRADIGILANNILSDNAPLCLFTFTDPAVFTPILPGKVEAIQLARESLDRYLAGATGYGIGREEIQADVFPSLLISAWDVIRVTGDVDRLRRWLPALEKIAARIEAQDRNCNGLPESTRSGVAGVLPHPSANWWDVINFGHEDAYVCALAYRAFRGMADLERLAGHSEQSARFEKRADRLREAYVPTFLNPKTGILAGWKDSEGNLHDYWFVFVNALAITYGLVPDSLANSIIDRIEAKFNEVGYTRFDLGLPGNLIPIKKPDYIPGSPGAPQKEDGSDTYGIYQNGGATACYAYFYIQALYQLGRRAEAERILWPMMETYARGGFQNGIGHGGEWRDWNGKPSGYEGFLADAYYAQIAIFTGHYGISFGPEGFQLAQWSPLKGKTMPLGLQYMGKTVETVE